VGARDRNGREHSEDGADDHISGTGSKVFEFSEGGAAAQKPGRRKLNVFARWAILSAVDFGQPGSKEFADVIVILGRDRY
jgi:hypothetical protein